MAPPSYYDRKALYARLWVSMEVRASKAADIKSTARKIIDNQSRYAEVAEATGVPWYVVGLIHAMEAGGDFNCHLHNGDSLARRTVQVPAGRPKDGKPPFKWQDSAIDAVRYDGLDKVGTWSIERICYELEKFNGWGYVLHHSDVNTPYLWSGSNNYARGKYVADGQWSSSAVSGQSGAMPILKCIMELDDSVQPLLSTSEPTPVEEKIAKPAEAFRKAVPEGGAVAGAAAMASSPSSVMATTADEAPPAKPSFWERFNFNLVNDFAEQGSRLAGSLRTIKTVLHGLIWGPPTASGAAVKAANTGTGQIAAAHPNILLMVVGVGLGISLAAVIVYLIRSEERRVGKECRL